MVRRVFILALTAVALAAGVVGRAAGAESAARVGTVKPPPVTVFFRFESAVSGQTLEHMRVELDRLFEPVPLSFDWLRLEEAPEAGVVGEAVVVRFRGNCSVTSLPPLPDERGPFASASVTDGVVQPFAEVNCDRVRAAVHYGLWGAERNQLARHLGIALGRVVAHEVYHMYFRTRTHGASGVTRHSLSPQELVAEKAELHPEDRGERRVGRK